MHSTAVVIVIAVSGAFPQGFNSVFKPGMIAVLLAIPTVLAIVVRLTGLFVPALTPVSPILKVPFPGSNKECHVLYFFGS